MGHTQLHVGINPVVPHTDIIEGSLSDKIMFFSTYGCSSSNNPVKRGHHAAIICPSPMCAIADFGQFE
jgi:hypothetical protein